MFEEITGAKQPYSSVFNLLIVSVGDEPHLTCESNIGIRNFLMIYFSAVDGV